MNHASSDCECVPPEPVPAKIAVRTVIGEVVRPPDMYRSLAAWFTIWSIAMPMKSMIMISATGR